MTLYAPYRYKYKVAKTPLKGYKESNIVSKRQKKKKRKAKKQKRLAKQHLREYKNRIPKKYKVYIKSIHWTKRKNQYYQQYGKKCAICFSSKYVDLHHKVYGNYGLEKDEHLVALCHYHHGKFHDTIKLKGNMHIETDTFIDEERQMLEFPKFV